MKILILRSIVFDDENESALVKELTEEIIAQRYIAAVYNMPAGDDANHWAGYAMVDYSPLCDVIVCLDFPTALIKHHRKYIVITKPLAKKKELQLAIEQSSDEAIGIYGCDGIENNDILPFPGVMEFVAGLGGAAV